MNVVEPAGVVNTRYHGVDDAFLPFMGGLMKLSASVLISSSQGKQAILELPSFLELLKCGLTGVSIPIICCSRGGPLVHCVTAEWENLLLFLDHVFNAFISALDPNFLCLVIHRDNAYL